MSRAESFSDQPATDDDALDLLKTAKRVFGGSEEWTPPLAGERIELTEPQLQQVGEVFESRVLDPPEHVGITIGHTRSGMDCLVIGMKHGDGLGSVHRDYLLFADTTAEPPKVTFDTDISEVTPSVEPYVDPEYGAACEGVDIVEIKSHAKVRAYEVEVLSEMLGLLETA